MIAKVQRHGHTDGLDALLHEMYQPAQPDPHGMPRLIAGSPGPGTPAPGHGQAGGPDITRLIAWLADPLAQLATHGYQRQLWQCTVRAHPRDRALSDQEWAQIAADILHRTGLAPRGDSQAVRWITARHGTDHIHIVATLARQDGTLPRVSKNLALIRNACHDAESRYRLHSTRQGGSPLPPRPASAARLACLDFPVPPAAQLPGAASATPLPVRRAPARGYPPRRGPA
jgi:hypothetical protein